VDALIVQDELRDSARRVLTERVSRQALLEDAPGADAWDRDLWKIVAELGWLGLAVPEDRGGLGQPFAALSTLFFELGRALSNQPVLGATLGLDALVDPATQGVPDDLVEAALSGQAVVVPLVSGDRLESRVQGAARRVDGVLRNVLDAPHATHLLVPLDGEIPAVALLALPHPAVQVRLRKTWDLTRQIADIAFDGLELRADDVIVQGEAADRLWERVRAHFDLALANDALGGAGLALEETLAYMHQRHQFNRPIASFQALKHRCAEHKASIDAATALLHAARRATAEAHIGWQARVACARLYAGAVYKSVSEDCIQLHGGIGFTWEHPCHLFLKRARLGEVLGGSAELRKDAVAPVLFRLRD